MEFIFYFFGIITVTSTILVLFNKNPMHALLYFVISILSISGIFFSLGAFFPGVIEVLIYAGAIMVLFMFFIMILNLGRKINLEENTWSKISFFIIPLILFIFLFIIIIYIISFLDTETVLLGKIVQIKQVGIYLLGPYMVLVELSSLILLSALVVTLHLSNKK
ncbi:NADH-quinone oxidoreductase subunit J [Buchnera aphidicola (Eriosoma grossulariae)]|uniref:NADH-quinone oxidoreductase subunit J n=1 Tax=Buchnera aphidicola TaxID=9 RepID=UPI003464BEBB